MDFNVYSICIFTLSARTHTRKHIHFVLLVSSHNALKTTLAAAILRTDIDIRDVASCNKRDAVALAHRRAHVNGGEERLLHRSRDFNKLKKCLQKLDD